MVQVTATVHIVKRWYFWPALIFLTIAGKLRLIRNPETAARWLAENAMRLEVR